MDARQLVEHARERGRHGRVRVDDRAGVVARVDAEVQVELGGRRERRRRPTRRRGRPPRRRRRRARRARAPVGVIATRSPARAQTLPEVPATSPSAASRARRGGDRSRSALQASRATLVARRDRREPTRCTSAVTDHDQRRACSAPARPPRPARSLPPRAERRRSASSASRKAHAEARRRADVVVVGAGFAGLTAARELVRGRASRWSCSRRATASGGRVHNHELGGGEISERGGTFVGPTQDRVLALAERARRRHVRHLRHRRERLRSSDGERSTYSDTGPTGTAPPRPADPRRPRAASSRSSTRCRRRSRSTRRGTRRARAEWDAQTLETWVARQQHAATASASSLPVATPADLRRRAARALAALRPLLHRRVGRRAQRRARSTATSTRATARRCGALRRRLADDRDRIARRARPARRAEHAGAPDRAGRRTVRRRVRDRLHRPRASARSSRSRRRSPRGSTTPRRCRSSATSSRSACGQGNLIKVAAVYDTPFWREQGPHRHGARRRRPGQGDVRRLAARRLARASSSASSAATRRAQFARARRGRAARRGARGLRRRTSAREAAQPDRVLRDRLAGRDVDPRRPGRHPRPGHARRATARRCAGPSGASTGRARRRRRTGTATWTARSAPASAPPRRCSTRCEARAARHPARARGGRRPRGRDGADAPALGHERPRADPAPGLPRARLRRTPTAASTRARTRTPNGDTVPSRVFEYDGDGDLLRSWTVTRPGPRRGPRRAGRHERRAGPPGPARQVARRASLLLDLRTGEQTDYATLPRRARSPTTPPGARTAASTSPTTAGRSSGACRPAAARRRSWLRDARLDGGEFGTTGLELRADQPDAARRGPERRRAAPAATRRPGGSSACRSAPTAGPARCRQLWESQPADGPDGFGDRPVGPHLHRHCSSPTRSP